jgi:YidC/Oxa1 family membrane protein insertase
MENRTLIALLLAIIILFGWQFFLPQKPPQQKAPQTTASEPEQNQGLKGPEPQKETTRGEAATAGSKTAKKTVPAIEQQSTKQIVVETSKLQVTLGNLGGGITSVRLKDYTQTRGGGQGKELIENIAPYLYLPAVSSAGKTGLGAIDSTLFTADRSDITVRDAPETLTFSGKLTDGRVIRKIYTFYPDAFKVDVRVEGEGGPQADLLADLAVISLKDKPSYNFKGPFIFNGAKLEQVDGKLSKPEEKGSAYQWTGFDEGYFSFIFLPEGQVKPQLQIFKAGDTPVERFLFAGNALQGSLYFVPNKISLLKGLNIHAEKIVDFGWFDVIAKPMLWGMNFANKYTHNYGIDIILLTILIKIVFYPLSLKSYKSMKEMQKLQPIIAKIKEKYKNDKEKLNKEMMDVYRTHKINPLGGCLPMAIQIPFFIALYKVLGSAIEFRHAPFMLWINDLSAPEYLYNLTIAGFTLPLRLLPLIMGITMVIQQKMTPSASMDPMQEKMMLLMPVVFTFIFWGFPAGLVLYWLVNNVISIGQQYYINKQVA